MNSSCSATAIRSPARRRTMPTRACTGPGAEKTTKEKTTTKRTRLKTTGCRGRCETADLNEVRNADTRKATAEEGLIDGNHSTRALDFNSRLGIRRALSPGVFR